MKEFKKQLNMINMIALNYVYSKQKLEMYKKLFSNKKILLLFVF